MLKGEHLKYVNNFNIVMGKVVEVFFDRPSVLQIDGESIENVSSYKIEL